VIGHGLRSTVLAHGLVVLGGLALAAFAVLHLRLVRALVALPTRAERAPDLGDDEAASALPLAVAAFVAAVLVPTLALGLIEPAAAWLTGVAGGP
jgi:hypothetical protein